MKNKGLGLKLLTARTKRNYSYARLSLGIKVNAATLARIENGKGFHSTTALKIIKWIEGIK